MADILAGGPPEPAPGDPGRRRAGTALVVVLGLAAGGTWLAVHRDAPAQTAGRTPSATRPGWSAGRPSPAPPLQPSLTGVSTGGPTGLRLLSGGGSLTVIDAGTGALLDAPEVPVPTSGAVTQLLPVAGGTLVVVFPDMSGGEYGPGWVYLVRPGRAAVQVVRADEVVAGARPGRFWAFVSSRQQGGKATLTEMTTGGRMLSRRAVPANWQLLADTGSGLLVAAYREEGPGELTLVDPRSLRAFRSLGATRNAVAATPRVAAWTAPDCAETCDLVVGDLRGERRRTFRLTGSAGVGRAVFSPDERRLAIPYFGRHGGERPGTPGFVEVLDLATGRRTRVPGVATPEKQAAEVCWSGDGRWLGIAVRWPEEGYQRVGVWPVSGGRVVELPGRMPARYTSALLAVTPE